MKHFKMLYLAAFLVVMLTVATVSPVLADGISFPLEGNSVDYVRGIEANGGKGYHCGVDQTICGWDYWRPDKGPANVLAAIDGEIVCCGDGVDIVVTIQNDETEVGYLHMERVDVSCGDNVSKGQVIGVTGNKGHSDWNHLHFWTQDLATGQYDSVQNWSMREVSVSSLVDWRSRVKELAPSMQVYGLAETSYPGGIVIHHTVGDNLEAAITYHGSEARAPYNILVSGSEAYLTMDFGRKANHAGCANDLVVAECNNLNYFAISVVGDFRYDTLEPDERQALVNAIAWVLDQGVPAKIQGHLDVGNTECPGPNLYPLLGELLAEAQSVRLEGPSWVPEKVQEVSRTISQVLTFRQLKLKLENLWWLGWVIAAGLLVLLMVSRLDRGGDQTPYDKYWSIGRARLASGVFILGFVASFVFLILRDIRLVFVAGYMATGCLVFLLARMRESTVSEGEVTPVLSWGGRMMVTRLITWTLTISAVALLVGGLGGWLVPNSVPSRETEPVPIDPTQWQMPADMQNLPDFFKTEVANMAIEVDRIAREEDLPSEVLFVLWLKESGGRRQNPANGEGLFGFYDLVKSGEYRFQPSLVSDGELLEQLRLAAKEFRRRSVRETGSRDLPEINRTTTNPDVLGWSYVVYNGNILCGGAAASDWQDHPYVMNGYDSAHQRMMARTSAANPNNCVSLQVIGAWPAHIRVNQLMRSYD